MASRLTPWMGGESKHTVKSDPSWGGRWVNTDPRGNREVELRGTADSDVTKTSGKESSEQGPMFNKIIKKVE